MPNALRRMRDADPETLAREAVGLAALCVDDPRGTALPSRPDAFPLPAAPARILPVRRPVVGRAAT